MSCEQVVYCASTDTVSEINDIVERTCDEVRADNQKPESIVKQDKTLGLVLGLSLVGVGIWDVLEWTTPSVICGTPFVAAGGIVLYATFK